MKKKKPARCLLLTCLLGVCVTGLAQTPPFISLSDSARLFAKDVISTGDFEFNSSFAPDGKTVYFSRATPNFGYIAIFYSVRKGSGWSAPEAVSFTGVYRDTDPFVTADGKRLYFSSDRPVNGAPYKDRNYHYFYVELNKNEVVSEPAPLELPNGIQPLYISFTDNGDAYFFSTDSSSDGDIYTCAYKDGGYLPAVALPFNDKKYFDFDPVVARDGSFIIFCRNNRKGLGFSDLYVSFKNGMSWSEPFNLGGKVNSQGYDGSPGLSRDNKTLYFSANREIMDRPRYKDNKPTTQAILDVMHSTKDGLRHIYEISIADLKQPAGK